MYKVTLEEMVGQVKKVTTVETDNLELIIKILEDKKVIKIDSDEPNRNISDGWFLLQDTINKKYKNIPNDKLVVTC